MIIGRENEQRKLCQLLGSSMQIFLESSFYRHKKREIC